MPRKGNMEGTPSRRVCNVPTATPGMDTSVLACVFMVGGVPEPVVEGFEPPAGSPCAGLTAAVVPCVPAVGANPANAGPGFSAGEEDPNMVLSHSICSGVKGVAILDRYGFRCPPARIDFPLCFQTATTCCTPLIAHARTLAYLTPFTREYGRGRPCSRR